MNPRSLPATLMRSGLHILSMHANNLNLIDSIWYQTKCPSAYLSVPILKVESYTYAKLPIIYTVPHAVDLHRSYRGWKANLEGRFLRPDMLGFRGLLIRGAGDASDGLSAGAGV
jgi:hypothetical protein